MRHFADPRLTNGRPYQFGILSPKWILNASSAAVQFRVFVQAGTAFLIAR